MLIAEVSSRESGSRGVEEEQDSQDSGLETGRLETRIGYLIGCDRYKSQDHVGIIYQVAVEAAWRRSLVAAMLVQAKFDRSAYGTRLYGLWCRQDLEANRFWEALGFVPIAFRAGSRTRRVKGVKSAGVIHLYWQKPTRGGGRCGVASW